jgi:hypothetical protein
MPCFERKLQQLLPGTRQKGGEKYRRKISRIINDNIWLLVLLAIYFTAPALYAGGGGGGGLGHKDLGLCWRSSARSMAGWAILPRDCSSCCTRA